MEFDLWIKAENFYNLILPISLISLALLFSGLVLIASYADFRKKSRKWLLMVTLMATLLNIGNLLHNHERYNTYLEASQLINPLTRDRTVILWYSIPYTNKERTIYRNLNDLESLQQLDLYDETIVSESITYLGENRHLYYFRQGDTLFKSSKTVSFTVETEEAKIVGSRFTLKDQAYEEIGFQDDLNIMFQEILVDAKEKNKEYSPENEQDIPDIQQIFRNWNF